MAYSQAFQWGGRWWTSKDKAAFAKWLGSRGASYATWASKHPQLAKNIFGATAAPGGAKPGTSTPGMSISDWAGKQYDESEVAYRQGLSHCGRDATLLFNLAMVLEDAHRLADAADMYRAALKESPDLPEAHYNLALLCEAAGLKQEAIRHLSAYRKLSKR